MFQRHLLLVTALCAGFLASSISGCGKGSAGTPGTPGTTGGNGTPGSTGLTTGTITGTLTYQPNPAASPLPAAAPASNVTVTDISITDSVVSTTTDATGTYTLSNVPVGIHSLMFSGNAFASLQVDGISVMATKVASMSRLLIATNPIVLTPAAASAPAGFNAPATLVVAVSGGTAPYLYKWTAASANPTAVTLSDATAAAPTFTTAKLADILASKKAIGFGQVTDFSTGVNVPVANPQVGFLGVSVQQLAQMTYNFTVTVTDATGFVKTAIVAIPPATLAQGNGVVPLGQIVIANIPGNTTAATIAGPAGPAVTLNDASSANPWFIPVLKGNYKVAVGSNVVAEVNASNFTGAKKDCGLCHGGLSQAKRDNVASKFKDWSNSAHGNHFFKYMHYDASGALVWNMDASGKPIPAPTANPTVFWSQPGAMTTYQFGLSGAEGTHYGASCTGCHTTGSNALASNNGIDDVMAMPGSPWVFPNLTTSFPVLTGATSSQVMSNGAVVTLSYDQVTAAPNKSVWAAIPDAVKAYAGMQCESCHGPLGGHSTNSSATEKPVAEFNAAACAVCHDRPSNHDRVSLWRQSKHANLEVAIVEGAGVSAPGKTAAPRPSCNRCHSAQGFVQYVNQLTGNLKDASGVPVAGKYPGNIVDPSTSPLADAKAPYLQGLGITLDKVQAITCVACHDPHTTGLRLDGDTPMLPSGFAVTGAGSGAICFACHNSRNGARGDQLNGVYTNNDNPGTPAPVTAIGAPHEACQGDVVAGRNAFFSSANKPSAHMAVKDTCVGCHMHNFPAGVTGTNTNHTWKIDSTSCASCHGGAKDPVNGEALQSQFDGAVADLNVALNSVSQTAVRGLYYKGSVSNLLIPMDAVVTFTTGRGSGFAVTFSSAVQDPNGATGTMVTVLGTSTSPVGQGNFYTDAAVTTKAFDVLKGTLAKANWNYALLTQDASRGVHNPRFSFDVLTATVVALNNSALAR